MDSPSIDNIILNLEVWFRENFSKAVTEQAITEVSFEFRKIAKIASVWKTSDDCWIVDALVDYFFHNQKTRTFTFQINKKGGSFRFRLKLTKPQWCHFNR